MSETITEENTTTEENITTIDHASATETISGQEDTSAAENASGQEDTSASSSTTIQKDTSASKSSTIQEDTSASGSTTTRKNASVINNATAPGTESAYNLDSEMDPFDKAEKERERHPDQSHIAGHSSGFFARFSAKIANIHSRREARLVRDEIILSRIPDKDLMEYLKLEQKRLESQQHAREIREKRIWIAFQMTIALIAAVLVIYFLKDSPAILISILYTAGLLIAFNIWNKHKDGRSPKDQ